ncbi:cell division cycle-associated protein 2 [Sphaerodactylus townsendi]|uniref:Uncharacterized protein n=1 Tax=Sphaerodactylus townsendi TaxID=933632 RepID=A0ACB8EX52_9SAUR|nr:cell division cycle-associated protein 2 [Sphaerodactylus townsendi]XP_048369541.1 cell division cycle-associated protein 2 [Sphaerodactylus townsendi]XP_048369542.1 cell division cycle-associated protein 2 [Sphaerodactylus townsendi]
MENLSNKKVLSVSFDSAKEEDCHSSYSSDLQKENVPTNAFTFSMVLSNLGSPLPVDKPNFGGNANYITPDKGEREAKATCAMDSPSTPSKDFSVLTAADFGITPETFTKPSGETKSILKKLRRQSTIGVRGSPENNALIRYIAHRKRMRNEDSHSQTTPFQRNVLLKDKIASFQSSFDPLKEDAEEIIHIPCTSKKADTRSHEQSQLDQVAPSEYKAVGLEETLNCKSTKGEKNSADIQKIPVVDPNPIESLSLPLEVIPAAGISKTASGIQSQNSDEELNSNATSQQSCKKVRFAEKHSLEIFDETKPPFTPLQKGCFPSTHHDSSGPNSVLKKKTPVKMLTKDVKEQLDYTNTRKGSEELSIFQSCGPLQAERSTRPIEEMEARNKELDTEVFDTLQPVATPVHSGETSFSPSRTRNDYSFNLTPIKKPLSQPNFDNDDDFQETLEVVSTVESIVNSGVLADKETKVSSPDFPATCIRVTRSCAKKKVNKVEETSVSPIRETQTKRACTTDKIPNPRKIKNVNSVTKSASQKTPASKRKAFGRRKRKKKAQKVCHGHCETVSKKPLLSPIPEMMEDVSLTSSYQSIPDSSVSILDRSCSSVTHETLEKVNSILHGTEKDSRLSAVTEDALSEFESCSSLQLQDSVLNNTQVTFSLEPPGNDSFKTLNDTLNGLVLKSNSESEIELGLLNLQETGKKPRKDASLLSADSAEEQLSGGDVCVNVKRVKRRSRRISRYLPSVEDFQSETARNSPSVPRDSMEELSCTPQTVNNAGFFNDVLYAIEESFKSATQKRVRRSMRLLKNEESEGLTWISVPTDDSVNQAATGSACRMERKSYTFCHPESEMLYQKEENLVQSPSPMTDKQKSPHTGVKRYKSKKTRKSICS